jgi:hydroxymethylpyrimidine pyrophosphatase-like HAD family hydrolase
MWNGIFAPGRTKQGADQNTTPAMEIVVSDFDNTLFKRNHGLIKKNVEYVQSYGLPVYIVTYRAEDQVDFIKSQLAAELNIIGVACAGSRSQDPATKIPFYRYLNSQYEIAAVLEDDERVIDILIGLGII